MLNLVAFVICILGAAAQWNDSWALFFVCAFFAIANGCIGANWIINKIKNRKRV